jgi:hypothetical protein
VEVLPVDRDAAQWLSRKLQGAHITLPGKAQSSPLDMGGFLERSFTSRVLRFEKAVQIVRGVRISQSTSLAIPRFRNVWLS